MESFADGRAPLTYNTMAGTMFIHGHPVRYDESDEHGVHHLTQLDIPSAKVYFDHARMRGSAEFEDLHGRKFVLEHNHDGTYGIVGRD